MNNKFLDKVIDQIMSETRVIDGKLLYAPFRSVHSQFPLRLFPHSPSFHPLPLLFHSFTSHCRDVYSLNDKETDYVWEKYKKEVTTLINDMELTHQEK